MDCDRKVVWSEPYRDYWGGHPPKCEKLVRLGEKRYAMIGRRDSGEEVVVPLGRLVFRLGRQ